MDNEEQRIITQINNMSLKMEDMLSDLRMHGDYPELEEHIEALTSMTQDLLDDAS
jgi:hypothetical protein